MPSTYDIGAFLIDNAVRTSLFLAAILLISALLGSRRAILRNDLWRLGLVGSLLLPMVPLIGTLWHLPVQAPSVSLTTPLHSAAPTALAPRLAVTMTTPSTAPRESTRLAPREAVGTKPRQPTTHPVPWIEIALGLSAVGTFVMLWRTMACWLAARRMRLQSLSLHGSTIDGRCQQLAARLDLRRPVTPAISDEVTCPTQVGILRPAILLPPSYEKGVADSVLVHELAHVRLHSVAFALLGRLLVAMHWYNPIVWIALRGERMSGEQVCDDWATTIGQDWRSYAAELIDAARDLRSHHPVALAQLVRPSSLTSRVERIRRLAGQAAVSVPRSARCLVLAISSVAVLSLGTVGAASAPVSVPLGDTGGWDFEVLPAGFEVSWSNHALNNAGQVAGTCGAKPPTQQACLWSDGQVQEAPIEGQSKGYAMSENGTLVGSSAGTQPNYTSLFLWRDGETETIPAAKDVSNSMMGVTDRGSVIGQVRGEGGHRHAFVVSDGIQRMLPSLGISAIARAINESDLIVGSSTDSTGTHAPVFWHPETGLQSLWVPPRFAGGAAADIVNDGTILVNLHECDWGDRWDSLDCRFVGRPFLYELDGRRTPLGNWRFDYTPLPHPAGHDDVRGQDINEAGRVLLTARQRDKPDEYFITVDDQLFQLPQPGEGTTRLEYYTLNDQGWLAGNIVRPRENGGRDVIRGFIARPDPERAGERRHLSTVQAAEMQSAAQKQEAIDLAGIDAFFEALAATVDSTTIHRTRIEADAMLEGGIPPGVVLDQLRVSLLPPTERFLFAHEDLERITTNPSGTNASRFVVISVQLDVADRRQDAPPLSSVERKLMTQALETDVAVLRSIILEQLQNATVDSLDGSQSRAAFFQNVADRLQEHVEPRLGFGDRQSWDVEMIVTDMIIQ